MKIEQKTYKLKNGSFINIRTAEPEDAQHLINLKRGYLKNTTTIPMYIDEYPDDSDKEKQLIVDYIESSNSILLVAENNNVLIGNIDLTGSKRLKMQHTAMIGMGIKQQWRNQGLGKHLINTAIDWAKKYSPIELIWLDVYSSNQLGINLYENTGFKTSGIIKGFFKEEDGYKDKIQMYQQIK